MRPKKGTPSSYSWGVDFVFSLQTHGGSRTPGERCRYLFTIELRRKWSFTMQTPIFLAGLKFVKGIHIRATMVRIVWEWPRSARAGRVFCQELPSARACCTNGVWPTRAICCRCNRKVININGRLSVSTTNYFPAFLSVRYC